MSDRRARKAVIPAAGLGTRFLPATKATPKEMLPVVDKPAIQYVVEEAVAAGVSDILIITGRGKRSIADHFDRSFELEHHLEAGGKGADLDAMHAIADLADIHYVRQGRPLGLGHAVATARAFVGDEPFAVLLPDDLMHHKSTVLADMIDTQASRNSSVIALRAVPPSEISLYGCAGATKVDDHVVQLTEIVEKPSADEAPSNLAVMGRYVFTPSIFEALERVKPGKGGEIQLTDGIQLLIESETVYGWTFDRGRFDIGSKIDYLRATVELALERDDLAEEFRAFLYEVVDRERAGESQST